MTLSQDDVDELVAFRRALHARPELSGEEAGTAASVRAFLDDTRPDHVLAGLGGHGLAIVYEGREAGPTVVIRSELDGLPIQEISTAAHRSAIPGKGHLCGHDGHTAILAGVGRVFGRSRPVRGRVVLLFQPAEETGAGAAAIVAEPAFRALAPDVVFSLHNWPGLPFGEAVLDEGIANCASRGLRITLTGRTAHAAMPETGESPMPAMASLMPALAGLGNRDIRAEDFAMVTITHAALGAPAFGVAPGAGEIWATLRTRSDEYMADLCGTVEALVAEAAVPLGLTHEITHQDVFHHCRNDGDAVARLRRALDTVGIRHGTGQLPMRPSEDFGRYGALAPSAMLFLGAGVDHPSLHNPDYDFPDDLIPVGVDLFATVARQTLG